MSADNRVIKMITLFVKTIGNTRGESCEGRNGSTLDDLKNLI